MSSTSASVCTRNRDDVAPGDDRFLITVPPAPLGPSVLLAEHWFTELRAKLKP